VAKRLHIQKLKALIKEALAEADSEWGWSAPAETKPARPIVIPQKQAPVKVGEASTVRELIKLLKKHRPDAYVTIAKDGTLFIGDQNK